MRTREGSTLPVHLLIHTRAANFDYQWVYGLDDKSVESALQDHILKWLNTTLLSNLHPVTTFFRFNNYCVLMIAEQSDTRTDPQSRPIFQRAIFLWEGTDGLYYRHLEPLANFLAEEAQKIYAELPDDVYRVATKTYPLEVDVKALEAEAKKINLRKCYWELPAGLTWQDIVSNKLTVEVPGSWSFDRMIAGLVDQPLSLSETIFIGNSLHIENRFPPNQSWVISAKPSNGKSDDSIRLLRADGQPLQQSELQGLLKKRSPAGDAPARVKSMPSRPSEQQRSPLGDRGTYKEVTKVTSKHEGAVDSDPCNHSNALGRAEIEKLYSEFSDSRSPYSKSNKWELMGLFKKIFERSHMSIVEAETQILLLLAPASQSVPSDITVAWHYLLNEILLSYQNPSKEMLKEWIDRIYRLETITLKNIPRPHEKWLVQFKKACSSLRTILQDIH